MADMRRGRSGNAMLEFTLVGIPMIFILISVFEMARGMWVYHTLAYAVKEGARFAIVHGQNCGVRPNICEITVGQLTTRIKDAGVGLMPQDLAVALYYGDVNDGAAASVTCNPLASCLANGNFWPDPANPGAQVGQLISIRGAYPFRSALSMFWPGNYGPVKFMTVNFGATSTEEIQF
jgi:Flp pilus assembly protein TadG